MKEDIEKKLKEKYKYVMGNFNKKEATLVKEFARFSELHSKMVFALALYHNPSLFEHICKEQYITKKMQIMKALT